MDLRSRPITLKDRIDAAIQNSERRTSVVSKNKRKKLKGKRPELSKEQKLAFLEDCQNSHLTIAEYAKANKLGKSTLYLWAVLYDIPLRDYYTKEEREIEPHNQRILDEKGQS